MDPHELLAKEWHTVERLVAATCHRLGLTGADADLLESTVKIQLFENDCKIIRAFRNECKFSTYLKVIILRAYANICVHRFGKWHASAAAKRFGPAAVLLEQLIYRDGCPAEEAMARVATSHRTVSRAELSSMLMRIPVRQPRPSTVSIEAVEQVLPDKTAADGLLIEHERRTLSERAATITGQFFAKLDPSDRLMLQLQFRSNLSLAQIARMMQKEKKPFYRRREQLLRDLRQKLTAAGITDLDVEELIGHISEDLDFGLGKIEISPTTKSEDPAPSREKMPS
jgi:DNA-directed RNA polymerase specialized sigma24 family protein